MRKKVLLRLAAFAAAGLATPALADSAFDVAYSGSGLPLNIQISYDTSTDLIDNVQANPNAPAGTSTSGIYSLLSRGSFGQNDNLVNPGPRLDRNGVSFTITQGNLIYTVNVSDFVTSSGDDIIEVYEQSSLSSGSGGGGTPGSPGPIGVGISSLGAPGPVPGAGLANLALLAAAAFLSKRRAGPR